MRQFGLCPVNAAPSADGGPSLPDFRRPLILNYGPINPWAKEARSVPNERVSEDQFDHEAETSDGARDLLLTVVALVIVGAAVWFA